MGCRCSPNGLPKLGFPSESSNARDLISRGPFCLGYHLASERCTPGTTALSMTPTAPTLKTRWPPSLLVLEIIATTAALSVNDASCLQHKGQKGVAPSAVSAMHIPNHFIPLQAGTLTRGAIGMRSTTNRSVCPANKLAVLPHKCAFLSSSLVATPSLSCNFPSTIRPPSRTGEEERFYLDALICKWNTRLLRRKEWRR